jgi:predicted glycoside hydrolase/deacetylase ChbG (UPF0249 family)
MLIINADDWGRSVEETEAALEAIKAGTVTSVSAMMFMGDSDRAAELSQEHGVDVGLHLNFSEEFTDPNVLLRLRNSHRRTMAFLKGNKYAQLFYNPSLRRDFAYSVEVQMNEFRRLYGRAPSHVDGHHHMHLCANVLCSAMIPGGLRMRRNFSFARGEKSLANRTYRGLIDCWLGTKYRLSDYFFDLTQSLEENKLEAVARLAQRHVVELMTHPINERERAFLMSDKLAAFQQRFGVELGRWLDLEMHAVPLDVAAVAR